MKAPRYTNVNVNSTQTRLPSDLEKGYTTLSNMVSDISVQREINLKAHTLYDAPGIKLEI